MNCLVEFSSYGIRVAPDTLLPSVCLASSNTYLSGQSILLFMTQGLICKPRVVGEGGGSIN